jgi:hypothetical protein
MGTGIALAVVLAAAALVVSLTRESGPSAGPTASDEVQQAGTSDTSQVDRALCEELAPLVRESEESGKRFVNLGRTGTPERDAGIPDFRREVEDWSRRIQPILDEDAGPPRYLTRTLQRFVDYTRIYASSIRPGPATEFDAAAWNNRVVNYGGPLELCRSLGIEW